MQTRLQDKTTIFVDLTTLASKPLLALFIPVLETRVNVGLSWALLHSVGETKDKAD